MLSACDCLTKCFVGLPKYNCTENHDGHHYRVFTEFGSSVSLTTNTRRIAKVLRIMTVIIMSHLLWLIGFTQDKSPSTDTKTNLAGRNTAKLRSSRRPNTFGRHLWQSKYGRSQRGLLCSIYQQLQGSQRYYKPSVDL
jgi:hypothetical protein